MIVPDQERVLYAQTFSDGSSYVQRFAEGRESFMTEEESIHFWYQEGILCETARDNLLKKLQDQ